MSARQHGARDVEECLTDCIEDIAQWMSSAKTDFMIVVCDTSATAPAQQGPRDIRWICHMLSRNPWLGSLSPWESLQY